MASVRFVSRLDDQFGAFGEDGLCRVTSSIPTGAADEVREGLSITCEFIQQVAKLVGLSHRREPAAAVFIHERFGAQALVAHDGSPHVQGFDKDSRRFTAHMREQKNMASMYLAQHLRAVRNKPHEPNDVLEPQRIMG